mmetsp:Transcript_15016/g.32200  ORF Transcript_15016/g.32200 Transcript_15016/m.32200 type:complete len:135 (-) Transcript_15016:698-1102(-)
MGKTHGTSLSQRGNRSTYDYSDIFSGFETDNAGSLLYNDNSNDINILASRIKSSRGRRLSNSSGREHENERECSSERQRRAWEELERDQPEPEPTPTPTPTVLLLPGGTTATTSRWCACSLRTRTTTDHHRPHH